DRVLHDAALMQQFLGTVGVNVTTMFRDSETTRCLREEVVPLLKTYPSCRLWVAGCATGEEVYALAVVLEEEGLLGRCTIYATDLNEEMLAIARLGSYPLDRIRRFDDAYVESGGRGSLSDHYSVVGRSARFNGKLGASVTWARHNLVSDGSFNDFHVIVCSNVLIYFRESIQARVHRLFYDSLIRGGYLVLRLPIMDGFETAQLIRQRPASELTPIIFVTALDQAETDMGRGYNLGAVDFVFAPVVPAIMRAKVSVFVELYRAQQELRRYRTQLETLVEERTIALTAINRELEAFSYSVSHDLRGPLVSFDAMSQMMLESYGGQLDEDATANLERMREASKRMTSVFDGLQMLFRLTSGEIRREQTDVSALAAQIVQEQQAEYPDRKVEGDIAP